MKNDIILPEYPQEILWEFTLKCNKNCCYCGSKDILKKKLEEQERDGYETIGQIGIAQYITKVHPDEVTITGGEPSCEMTELVECVKILYDAGIKVKILTNGNLFQQMAGDADLWDRLDKMVNCYGLSLNELSDLNSIGETYSIKEKTTIITNFGTHNINDFDKIAKKAMQYNCWQVQLTIGNEYQLDIDQIKELKNKLEKVENSGLLNVVRADNFTCGMCKAGIYGFSITYDGLIVPCLSYRSWKSDMMVQGFIEDIEEIWKNGFKFNRERKFVPSCKTISGIEKLCLSNEEYEYIKNKPIDENLFDKFIKPKQKENVIFVYGVVNPKNNDWNTPTVYGVTDPKINLTDIENLKNLSNIQKFLKENNKNDEENN
jgi:MoaA/NifB/PqqE/SkfB family radical SAM enzyme